MLLSHMRMFAPWNQQTPSKHLTAMPNWPRQQEQKAHVEAWDILTKTPVGLMRKRL